MGGCCYRAKSLQAKMGNGEWRMENGRVAVGEEEEGCVMEQTDGLREALHKKSMQQV